MNIQTLDQCPQNHRGGQVSHLLLAAGQFGSENLAVTWVEGEPGSEQAVHSHDGREQVYVIVQGRGAMRVGDEVEEVGRGAAILVPPGNRPLHPQRRRRQAHLRLRNLAAFRDAGGKHPLVSPDGIVVAAHYRLRRLMTTHRGGSGPPWSIMRNDPHPQHAARSRIWTASTSTITLLRP